MIENVLTEHDTELLNFYYKAGVRSHLYAWTLLETAFSEVSKLSFLPSPFLTCCAIRPHLEVRTPFEVMTGCTALQQMVS